MDTKRYRNFLWLIAQLTAILVVTAIIFEFPPIVLLISLAAILVPTTLLASLLYWQYRRTLRQKAKRSTSYASEETLSIELDLPKEKALDLCLKALDSLNGTTVKLGGFTYTQHMHIRHVDDSHIQSSIYPRSRFSRSKRYGLHVHLEISAAGEDVTRVDISSQPIIDTAFIDFGYGLQVTNTIAHYLRRENARLTGANRLREQDGRRDDLLIDDADERWQAQD